jgi:hypothetical protein
LPRWSRPHRNASTRGAAAARPPRRVTSDSRTPFFFFRGGKYTLYDFFLLLLFSIIRERLFYSRACEIRDYKYSGLCLLQHTRTNMTSILLSTRARPSSTEQASVLAIQRAPAHAKERGKN